MLTRLEISNFKSWPEAKLELAPITGLFGANSSGKSALLQLLLLLKQTREATDRTLAFDFGNDRTLVNLGTFRDIVLDHDENKKISWEIQWKRRSPLKIRVSNGEPVERFFDFEEEQMGITGVSSTQNDRAVCRSIVYTLGEARFALEQSTAGKFELRASGTDLTFKRIRGRPAELPGPMKSYAYPDPAKTNYQNTDFLAELEAAYEEMMDGVFHLGPLREYPKRQYGWAGARPVDVGRRGELVVEAMLAARAPEGKQNLKPNCQLLPFEKLIAHWLKEVGLIEKFRIEEISKGSNLYRAWVRTHRKAPEVLITDVGFGISQVLPAIVLLHYVPEGSTVILEQPEIHLHPRVQANLADVIVHAASHRHVQVILESHSEHLLRRLQRRIAEETLSADMVRLYFCRMERGHSTLDPIRVNEYGKIENWPEGFFDSDIEDIFALEEAALKRQMAAE